MASILLISKHGDGYGIADRLAREGHIVRCWFNDKETKITGTKRKNPKTVSSWQPFVEYVDLILFDMVGLGHIADGLSKRGRVVLGGSSLMDKLELDRSYSIKVVKELTSLEVPFSKEFSSVEEGIKYAKEVSRPLVLKPLGNKATHLTFVSTEAKNETLISTLENYKDEVSPFLLQDVIEGVEISTEGWFNGKDFVTPFNHTIEKKRFLEGDKGPNTGCMGNIVWFTEGDEIVKKGLLPLVPLLKRANYIGPIDINCIVQGDKIYFLEMTTRFGYDAIQAMFEGLKMKTFDFLYKIATGTVKSIKTYPRINASVRVTMPPFPNGEDYSHLKNLKVLNLHEEAKKHFWPADVIDDDYNMVGIDGVIGTVTAYGDTPREAVRRCLRTINNSSLTKDLQFRTDIDKGVEEDIKKLENTLREGVTK